MSTVGASGSSSMFCCCAVNTSDVLEERRLDLLEHLLGHVRVARLEVVGLRPEIMRGLLGLRRDRVQVAHLDAADAVTLGRAGAGRRRADVEPDEAGGRKSMICQRSTLPVKPPILTKPAAPAGR